MASLLQEYLNEIKSQKEQYLLPENLKKDVSLLGVTGTMEGITLNNQDITVTENGEYVADEDYTGLGTVTVNVQSNNQDMTITENGIYTADDTFDGLGTVTVTVNNSDYNAKVFETADDMNADPLPLKGDIAILYYAEQNNITEDSTFSTIYFPDTVTLPEEITSAYDTQFNSESGEVYVRFTLAASQAMIDIQDMSIGGMYDIIYTSEDGITYTNTTTEYTSPIELSVEVSFEEGYEWTDYVGYFIQTTIADFGGIYQYDGSEYKLINTQLTAEADHVYASTFYGLNGIESGTLGTDISSTFNDTNAEVAAILDNYYKSLGTIIVTDDNYSTVFGQSDTTAIPSSVSIDTSAVTTMRYMFSHCLNLTSLDLSDFNTSSVTNMYFMFGDDPCLTELDLSSFDTSNVTDMRQMFYDDSALISLNLRSFNTSGVTAMISMFYNCQALTSLDLSSFDTTNVTSMSYMFYNCQALTSLDLSSFTGTTATAADSASGTVSAKVVAYMFRNCISLQMLDISGLDWRDTSSTIFTGCIALETVYVKDSTSKTACDTALSAAGLSITSTIKEEN